MKQLLQDCRTGDLRVAEVPVPALRPGGILVKNHYSLVSAGTERAVIEFARQSLVGKARSRPDLVKEVLNKIKTDGLLATYRTAMQRLDEPLPLGYSCAGEVIEVGRGAEEFGKGDLVACGGGSYASHAEVVFVPKNLAVKIPENVTTKEAAFVTLGAIALQGVRRAELTPGECVAVIGLGLIGQLTVQILNAYGFPVLGLDVSQRQVEKALKLGLREAAVIGQDDVEKVARAFSDGQGVDAVIITAATKSREPIELAGRICRDKGRVSVVGDVGMDIPRNLYYEKELDLRISRSYGPGRYDPNYEERGIDYPIGYVRWTEKRNMEEFLRLISIGRVDVKSMITHIFKIEDALKAYELILENPNKEDFTAVLLEYDPAKEHTPKITLKAGPSVKRTKVPVVNVDQRVSEEPLHGVPDAPRDLLRIEPPYERHQPVGSFAVRNRIRVDVLTLIGVEELEVRHEQAYPLVYVSVPYHVDRPIPECEEEVRLEEPAQGRGDVYSTLTLVHMPPDFGTSTLPLRERDPGIPEQAPFAVVDHPLLEELAAIDHLSGVGVEHEEPGRGVGVVDVLVVPDVLGGNGWG